MDREEDGFPTPSLKVFSEVTLPQPLLRMTIIQALLLETPTGKSRKTISFRIPRVTKEGEASFLPPIKKKCREITSPKASGEEGTRERPLNITPSKMESAEDHLDGSKHQTEAISGMN